MKKKIIFALAIIFLFIFAVIFVIHELEIKNSITRVCFKENCFNVELATTFSEHSRGLMFRESLDKDKGMLFVFKGEKEYPFWMKDILIPLDIIWINKEKDVVFISENSQPCKENFCPSINPGKNARYVLEINAGMAKQIGLSVGNKLNFSYAKENH